METQRLPLYYTFGNHMHWVDMEWLWGYFVLPSSVRDMLHFCAETGARGNVNFDGIGYEKLAVEAPEVLAELREAVQDGRIEVVGASYGQPYGLFHHGESNVRQRIYGVRVVIRLLGVRPRSFWEEEFDFFPQLPQILAGTGFRYASLFFQWTWHTPYVPCEEHPAIWWEGQDGTRLLAAPRNALNLHQWPEDFAGLLEQPLLREMPAPGIVQWLELMPSPDWMCRSEVLLPQLRALFADERFELRPVTLSGYLEVARPHAVPRRYTMDDVFHGMSLGKNGDRLRRLSRQGEQSILAAESISSLAGLFGRPYPSWNVYPTWELEEAWRELLQAQHHDNDECEGLCGFVGLRSYERSLSLSSHVLERTLRLLANRAARRPDDLVVYNPLGWQREAAVVDPADGALVYVQQLPPFGYRVVPAAERTLLPPIVVEQSDLAIVLRRGPLAVTVDRKRGVVSQIVHVAFPEGALREDCPLADLEMVRNGSPDQFERADLRVAASASSPTVIVERHGRDGALITITISLAPELDAVDIVYHACGLPRPDGRMHAALRTRAGAVLPGMRLIHDHPYGLSEVRAEGSYPKKYPTGDWMTSPQVFEEVRRPFTTLQLLDLDGGERGLLYLHDGGQAFLRTDDAVEQILTMYDPWDEDAFYPDLDARVRIVPHGPIDHAARWRLAQEFTRPALVACAETLIGDLPPVFGPVWCDAPGVAVTAWHRETGESGRGLETYGGAGIEYPMVLRLAELNGEAVAVQIRLPGEIASAFRTNLIGEIEETLAPIAAEPPIDSPPLWSIVAIALRPYEIATIYFDLTLARKVSRDLDSYRSVWATVHRLEE